MSCKHFHIKNLKGELLCPQAEVPAVKDMLEAGVLDTYLGKYWAIKLATNAAVTVLRVDQVRGGGVLIFRKTNTRGAQ